ncbi:hypothetical protein CDAR_616291 [Caerostris darwini]|uniref:Uncharacterized protein n=1 Tax=Caerostris darwini TaxID=1538125 RepID=A0AAV4WEX7_9ARAC|nr:hypothetical protein CDAR_616291 [Caerostris darwini]
MFLRKFIFAKNSSPRKFPRFPLKFEEGFGLSRVLKKMNIEFGDEEAKLIQKGFYVEEPNCCITLNTIPKDGNEFVLLQRLQTARNFEIAESQVLAKRKISEFNILRKKFHADKEKIKIEFPKKIEVPEDSEEEWCFPCLIIMIRFDDHPVYLASTQQFQVSLDILSFKTPSKIGVKKFMFQTYEFTWL